MHSTAHTPSFQLIFLPWSSVRPERAMPTLLSRQMAGATFVLVCSPKPTRFDRHPPNHVASKTLQRISQSIRSTLVRTVDP